MTNSSHLSVGAPLDSRRSSGKRGQRVAETRSVRMPHIQCLRKMLDELEIKLDARECLEHNGRLRYARRVPVEQDVGKILQSLQDLIDCYQHQPDTSVATSIADAQTDSDSRRSGKQSAVRIQLKLSPALVRVLQTVRKEQVKASDLVESVMWSSPRVQDTAQLAGIRCPRRAPAA